MELANITYQDEVGEIKVKIDYDKCIACGRCVIACKHDSRVYADDTERFFNDLNSGAAITIIAAPSIQTNIPEHKKLFTYLKKLGVNKIFDVSLGADISIWAHVRYIEKEGFSPIITQPCPVVVSYCEMYRHDLLKRLSPIHSPMACTSVYIKNYQNISDRIAAITPCIAKTNEFSDTGLAQYNVTFDGLLKYLRQNDIKLPFKETQFDHAESGLGSLFPMPGGLKENIEFFTDKRLYIAEAEGFDLYEKLNKYADTHEDLLPDVFDVLNCNEGCNIGPAGSYGKNIFEISKMMDLSRKKATDACKRDYYTKVYKAYDDTFDLSHFTREYRPISARIPQITAADIEQAFDLLGKTDYEMKNVDCGACGNKTCHDMARKIALNVNIPINCIVKSMEDARAEHIGNILAHKQLADMEKMREADERMRILLNANPVISILFDSSFKVVDCNTAALKFMKFESKESLRSGFVERMNNSPSGNRTNGKPFVLLVEGLAVAAKEGHVKFETELHLDGKLRYLDVEMIKIPYETNFAIIVNVFDMTDVRDRENELIRSREQNELQLTLLNLVIKATKIGLWDMEVIKDDPVNPENAFTWSDDFRHMLGYTDTNDFPNILDSWSRCLHPDSKDRIIEIFEKHMMDTTGATPYDIEYPMFKKNGGCAYFRDTGETLRDENGIPIRTVGALIDITETKNLINEIETQKASAEAANKAKSAFLSTMSHEIRTPMNAILGITEIQLMNEALDPGLKESFEKIYASGDLLLSIINDILDHSKIEAGKLELIVGKYDVASLISDTAQLNMMRIGSKQIDFELCIDENMPAHLTGDELRVKQILNNLLSNAFKYTAGGEVCLSVSSQPSEIGEHEVILVITVSDTGQGMTKEQVDRLFNEYEQFDRENNRTKEGTGLGMSITRDLLNLMDGKIFVESEPGKGSAFTVHLPQGRHNSAVLGKELADNLREFRTRSRAHMKRVQISRDPMPYGRVLIVDDVETNLFVARGLMAPYGLIIDSVDSGYAAIENVRTGKIYDIIFMDHMMPKLDGIETTKILRAMGYDQPIVALTANAVAGQADIFLGNGFDDFISKPIDIRQLNLVLNKLIRDKQAPDVLEAARKKIETEDGQISDGSNPLFKLHPRFTEIFARDAHKSLDALDRIIRKDSPYGDDDLRTYMIHVHGMKGALANVGNMDLSAVALKLELYAREGSSSLIAAETPAFLSALRDFVNLIAPDSEAKDGELPDSFDFDEDLLDLAYLSRKLTEIKQACEDYDERAADDALKALRKKAWPQSVKDLLRVISALLLHSDFEEVSDVVDKYITAKG